MVATRRSSARLQAKLEAQSPLSAASPASTAVDSPLSPATPVATVPIRSAKSKRKGTPAPTAVDTPTTAVSETSSSVDPFDPRCEDFLPVTPTRPRRGTKRAPAKFPVPIKHPRKEVQLPATAVPPGSPSTPAEPFTTKYPAREQGRAKPAPTPSVASEASSDSLIVIDVPPTSASGASSGRRPTRGTAKGKQPAVPPSHLPLCGEDKGKQPAYLIDESESDGEACVLRRPSRAAKSDNTTYLFDSDYDEKKDATDGHDDDSDLMSMRVSDSNASVEVTEEEDDDLPTSSRTPPARRKKAKRVKKAAKPQKLTLEQRHPDLADAWEKLAAAKLAKDIKHDQPATLKLKLLPFQRESLSWMLRQEASGLARGGILADEMGMGKTIQMIALLLSEPRGGPTLVVAPTVALLQWQAEIRAHTDALTVTVFYGNNRPTDPEELKKFDVVLTSYALIEGGFRRERYGTRRQGEMVKTPSILHAFEWHRIVLDESHCIKDRSCNTARATFALKANYKWSLSGTVFQNRIGELFSQLRFLQLDPFSYYFCRDCDCKSLHWRFSNQRECDDCGHKPMRHLCWWNQEILKPIQRYGCKMDGQLAFARLHDLLQNIMIRRTKLERAADLGLPPRNVVIRQDRFNDEETDLYKSLYSTSATKFNSFVQQGTVLSHYANIFELLTRLRLAANHPNLVTIKLQQKYGIGERTSTLVCAVCQDVPEDPIAAKCKHVFCRADAIQYLETSIDDHPRCPTCFATLTIDLTQPALESPDEEDKALATALVQQTEAVAGAGAVTQLGSSGKTPHYRGSIVNQLDLSRWQSSTKIEALVEELTNLRRENATIKSIVFSQFVNFLDLAQWRLSRAGFGCCRLDGRMTPSQRDAAIKAFSTLPEYTVFFISLKAGGVALNLTEASHVFICDPWWNPAVEDQAMDRIHRLGQFRPIKVTRLIIADSIESRIIELQEKKRALFQSTVGNDTSAMSRLTEEDMQFLFVL
ncbi:DNA repair protein rad16 [Tieghemiomyces parasiticus]|uniref:DNA repair protein rad16 n=1 Tax=Tieghemiomyces parasiticus TaxID=78921 RepID=A0A9W7ZMS3_9FUNG|nr:DNA repair protein rad16 [Tieghemiomyces parasiticus]